ncbi:hypothetical protein ACNI3K_12515 [Demequina sp. SO4-13]|uniref:hypothetical protein n=1 Tax=Demequina sp. SO4-13 TaxID=3401027 RepID=UPI003AF53652
MSETHETKHVLGGTVMSRGTGVALVALALVPPAAWLASLAGSYAIDDFACTAARSAGATAPSSGVLTAVLILNAALLVLTILAGFVAFRIGRRRRDQHPAIGFLGISTLASAVVFGGGIVFIALTGIALGGCS